VATLPEQLPQNASAFDLLRISRGVEILAEISGASARRYQLGVERVVHFPGQHLLPLSDHRAKLTRDRQTGARYACYRCRKCERINVSDDVLEDAFVDLLRKCAPNGDYARLMHAVVRQVWKAQQQAADETGADRSGVSRNRVRCATRFSTNTR
jgi:hypothetical protein